MTKKYHKMSFDSYSIAKWSRVKYIGGKRKGRGEYDEDGIL